MGGLWAFMSDPANREVLTWFGAGIAALGSGAWAVITYVARRGGGSGSGSVEQLVDRGGSAIGGDQHQNSHNRVTLQSGITGPQLALVLAIVMGAGLILISQVGSRVTAQNNSSAVGGDVIDSEINVGD